MNISTMERVLVLVVLTVLSAMAGEEPKTNGETSPAGKTQLYDIGAYYCPTFNFNDERWNAFFLDGNDAEWEIVRKSKPKFNGHRQPRVPLWGYEDEADPAVMEKKIEAAVSHGVNVFIFDWYWYDDKPFLEDGINNGFLKAKNNDQIKFYLMWANHAAGFGLWGNKRPYRVEGDWSAAVNRKIFDKLVDRWIEKYMKHPSYYKINGKPVFSIYETSTLIKGLGGLKETREALDYFESKVKVAGFPGLHVQAILWSAFPASVSMVPGDKNATQNGTVAALGIDSLSNYQYVHLSSPGSDYNTWAEEATKDWKSWSDGFSVPYFPHVSIDWDTNCRVADYAPCIKTGVGPENFKKYLLKAKAYADAHPDQSKLITINSWNEWAEGSYLEPDTNFKFGYLEAIRDVFGGGHR